MAISVKKTTMFYKDPTTGEFESMNVVGEKSSAEIKAEIEQTGKAILEIIPDDYEALAIKVGKNSLLPEDSTENLVDYSKAMPGFVGTSGNIANWDPVRLEKHTPNIPVEVGDIFYFGGTGAYTEDGLWFCVAQYDASGNLLQRDPTTQSVDYINRNGVQYKTGSVEITNASAAYIIFSWRSYGCVKPYLYKNINRAYDLSGADIFSIYRFQENLNNIQDICIITGTVGGNIINLDTVNKKLIIPGDTLFTNVSKIQTAGWRRIAPLSSAVEVPYGNVGSSAVKFAYHIDTEEIHAYIYNKNFTAEEAKNIIIFAALRTNGNKLSINAPYAIDGKMYGIDIPEPQVSYSGSWSAVKCINHRGYNSVAPENTLSAFKLSKQKGFDYVETDVQFTSDGIPVCIHDDTIDRTSNGTGNVSELTFEYLRTLDFGSWKSSNYEGEKIPSFEEFISLCRNIGLKPYVELKGYLNSAQINTLFEIVNKAGMRKNTTWISFALNNLLTAKQADDAARLGFLVIGEATDNTYTQLSSLKTSNNEVFVNASATSVFDINMCIANDYGFETWGANTESAILSADKYITGFTTDTLIASEVLKNNSL